MEKIDIIKHITGYSYPVCAQILNRLRDEGVSYGLKSIKGVGQSGIHRLIAASEFQSIIKRIPKQIIKTSTDVYDCISEYFTGQQVENFYVIYLSRRNQVIDIRQISFGGINGTVVDKRIIFKIAFQLMATCIILAHNHPSGNLLPSNADSKITAEIVNAGKIMDIEVLDHLIIHDNRYFSFADDGLL